MITKTTNLDSSYQSLFDEIRDKSDNSIDINNIEGFFGNIERIAQLEDKKFLRLPLDEPMFEINANTRNIIVPADFRTNGISVQGDHLAETVFFVIDRYFDYIDLSSTDISINWKIGNTTGRTKNFIMSKDIIPGSVVFGWPINNIITEKSGQLTFAVEFRKERDGEIIYDFNTLAANVAIKDGLIINGNVEPIALDNDILSILTNSAFGEGDAAVGNVTWVSGEGLAKNISFINDIFIPDVFKQTFDLETEIIDGQPSSIPVTVYAEGYVDDSTQIRYTNPNNLEQNVITYLAIPDYEDGAELPTNHKFYKKVINNGVNSYIPATIADIENWSAEEENERTTLYICLASLRIASAGNYIIKAQGEKYNDNTLIGTGESSLTKAVIIPEAEQVNEITITSNSINDLEFENYSIDPNTQNTIFLNEDEEGTLVATVDETINDIGALQFIWQKRIDDTADFENINEINNFTLDNESVQDITTEGQYKVLVKNFKNGTEATATGSDIWTASLMATPIISAVCLRNGVPANSREDFNSAGSMAQSRLTLTISDVDRGEEPRGTIEYQWKRGGNILEKENSNSITIDAEGEYTPIVRNVYNGSIYTKELPAVFVNDIANDQ